MAKYQIDNLEGHDLNRAVALAENRGFVNRYVEDVSIANTVLVRERITTGPVQHGLWYALYADDLGHVHHRAYGPTPQIAALRARVKKFVKYAAYIDLP